MRVLILSGSLAHTQAGAAHATLDFANALSERPGIEVFLYTSEYDPGTLHPNIVPIQYKTLPRTPLLWRFRHLTAVRQGRQELQRQSLPDVDVCYSQGLVWSAAYRSLWPSVPMMTHTGAVLHARERIDEYHHGAPWYVHLDAKLVDRLERGLYQQPKWCHIVSTSLVARQRAEHFGIPVERFKVCPYGVRVDEFTPRDDGSALRRQLEIPQDAVVIITVSRMVRWKNTEMLLRAYAKLPRDVQTRLLVVGEGAERPRLMQVARELGIDDRTHFTGHVKPAPYYAASDVFVLPSLIESFGVVYAEAMLTGLPCIGLRNNPPQVLSTAQDVIVDGTGYCVSSETELVERLTQLVRDPALCRRMGQAAQARARAEFSTGHYVDFFLRAAREEFGVTPAAATRKVRATS